MIRSQPGGQVAAARPPAADTADRGEGVADGLDAEGLRSYRLALARQARVYKRYPTRAMEAGWDGTAEVLVTVLEGGVPESPRLARSSGHALLDEAAVEMLRRALPTTPVPAALSGRTFAILLPVVFELPAD